MFLYLSLFILFSYIVTLWVLFYMFSTNRKWHGKFLTLTFQYMSCLLPNSALGSSLGNLRHDLRFFIALSSTVFIH